MTRIASGLNEPRGVDIGPNGAIFVAEAGTGGTDCRNGTIPGFSGTFCFGASGSITRIWRGHQSRILTGLASIRLPGEGGAASGPSGVSVHGNGNIEVTLGTGTIRPLYSDVPLAQTLGWLIKGTPGGQWTPVADVSAYEFANDPDGKVIDTNPFGVAAVPGGAVVADAAGNDVLWTDRAGHVSLLAVLPDRMATLPFPPFSEVPMEAVPTGVTVGPDGAYYIGELTGFPFPPGAANVYRLVPGEAPTLYAWGFTNIMDIDFAPDGTLFVAEISANGLLTGLNGALMKAAPGGGASQPVVTGLFAPGGLAVAGDGSVYVSTCAVCPGGGEVWHIQP